jgi:predicted house-cleaning noncanonical NTP pyrophosphatase (MazG superfamily)
LLQPDEPLTINRDTSDTAYIYYKNGFVECTKDGYSFCNYSKLKHFIGKNQIINRQFEINEQKNRSINELGIFARFCFNISFQENKRFESLQTIIGYCCHSFYETKLKAVNFTDSTISEQNEGRTGKSLFGKAIGKIKNCCDIPGKDFDPTKSFKFQMVQLDSQIVHLNDVRHGFDFESLYNVITDGLVVERKNMQPFPVSVKFIISSNKALNINGASSRDRIVEFEFSDHYSDKYSPADEFGLWLFTDFDQKEWNEFDNFMMNCITAYLAKGLIEPKAKNLNKRKLIQNTSHEFVEFMNEKFQSQELVSDNEYEKHDLHRKFLEEYSEFKEDRRLKKLTWFTKFCKQYAQFTEGIVGVKEGKSGNDRFITFLSDKSE